MLSKIVCHLLAYNTCCLCLKLRKGTLLPKDCIIEHQTNSNYLNSSSIGDLIELQQPIFGCEQKDTKHQTLFGLQ